MDVRVDDGLDKNVEHVFTVTVPKFLMYSQQYKQIPRWAWLQNDAYRKYKIKMTD